MRHCISGQNMAREKNGQKAGMPGWRRDNRFPPPSRRYAMELIAHETESLLVARKPAGWNTHAPGPYANEGLYEWLKHREPRWSRLAIIHRLDKETSGLIVFGKTTDANRRLSAQFEARRVAKKYLFLTASRNSRAEFAAVSRLARAGEKYISAHKGQPAETRFRLVRSVGDNRLWEAIPLTGRTHQIRVHAAENGIPILGDALYGGAPAARLCLHAAELAFDDPATGQRMTFRDPPDFARPAYAALRAAFIEAQQTNAYRVIHGAADGWPGLYVDRFSDFLLASSEGLLSRAQQDLLQSMGGRGVCHRRLQRQPANLSAKFVLGEMPPSEGFAVRENGVSYRISFAEGCSVGLFLDQRDNRRRLLTGYVAPGFEFEPPQEVLNTFAYTCSFSVCAAASGARTTSIDLSRKYLEWGRENFRLNQLDLGGHEFLAGDVFDWFTRLRKKGRLFDAVVLDPPTFSRSKLSGVFQAGKDYGRLTSAALPLVRPGGWLFASTNAADYQPQDFIAAIHKAIQQAGRKVLRQHYIPQPPDFPIHPVEPAYLKTLWIKLE